MRISKVIKGQGETKYVFDKNGVYFSVSDAQLAKMLRLVDKYKHDEYIKKFSSSDVA